MIEILLIFLQILFLSLLIFYSIPILKYNVNGRNDLLDKLSINIIILTNLILFFSLTNLNDYILLIFLISLSVFFLIKKKENILKKLDFKFFYIIFIIFFISLSLANKLDFGWDAKFFWFMKSVNFYENEKLLNLNKLPATDYPHLGSYIWSFFWKFPFNVYEYHGRIFYIFLYIISIFSFFEIIKVNLLNKIIYATLTIISTFSFELFSGNQEIIIFSLSLFCAKYCYLIFNNENKKKTTFYIFILLLIFNFAIWTKNEAIFLIGFFLVCIFFLANLNKTHRTILIIGSLVIIFFRIMIYKLLNTSLESFEFEKTISINHLDNLSNNIRIISFYIFIYLTQLPIMAIGLLILLFNIYKYKFDRLLIFVLIYFLFNILFIYGAFIFSMENVEWQVRVGLKRVMFETSGFYLITFAYLINKFQKKR